MGHGKVTLGKVEYGLKPSKIVFSSVLTTTIKQRGMQLLFNIVIFSIRRSYYGQYFLGREESQQLNLGCKIDFFLWHWPLSQGNPTVCI